MTSVNKIHKFEEVDRIDKKVIRKTIELSIFILLANLPYITITQTIGMDSFLDSFENPEYYLYFSKEDYIVQNNFEKNCYILLQKSSHPAFSIKQGDIIMYIKGGRESAFNEIYQINGIGSEKRYYITNITDGLNEEILYKNQIVGKVISDIDNNIWNTISMEIWDLSIHNFNVKALFSEQ